MEDDDRLPTGLLVDACIRRLSARGVPCYVLNRGAHASGTILLKLCAPGEGGKLLQQQRGLDGTLGWMALFHGETVPERDIDAYIARALDRDPDLWVIEVEDRTLENPFEGRTV